MTSKTIKLAQPGVVCLVRTDVSVPGVEIRVGVAALTGLKRSVGSNESQVPSTLKIFGSRASIVGFMMGRSTGVFLLKCSTRVPLFPARRLRERPLAHPHWIGVLDNTTLVTPVPLVLENLV